MKLGSPRLAFISCADASARLPIVTEWTRVDLARARVAVEQPEGMVVYLKGRFMPPDAPGREEQMAFDAKLLASGIVSEDGRGPRMPELHRLMRRRREAGPGDAG